MVVSEFRLSHSLFFHLALIAMALLFQKMSFLTGDITQPAKTKKVFIKQAIRVDVVGMPKHTLKELKQMKANSINVKEVKEVKVQESPVTKTITPDAGDFLKKKKKASFKDLIKGLSNKKVKVSKQKNKKRAITKKAVKGSPTGLSNKQLNKLIIEGNKISKGSSLTGSQADVNLHGVFENYIVLLPDHVRPYWKLPSYLLSKKLQCRIQVFLNGSGELIRSQLVESSGDKEFDTKALQAVGDAAPYPRPESGIVARLIKGEVILGFPL